MCFGHLAKLAVKSYMFRRESIGKVPSKNSNLSGCRRKTEVNLCIGSFGLEGLKVSARAYDLVVLGRDPTGQRVLSLRQSSLAYIQA
jgi:hypothetical protein